MRLNGIIYVVLLLCAVHERCDGLFGGASFQDYVDQIVDVAKLHLDTIANMNDSTIHQLWSYFKTKYGRIYSSLGLYSDCREKRTKIDCLEF